MIIINTYSDSLVVVLSH